VDVSRSEAVEHELNRLIERRHDQRTAEERPSEELWQESVERYKAERDSQLRTEWTEYHRGQAARHRAVLKALIATHGERVGCELYAVCTYDQTLLEGGVRCARLQRNHVPSSHLAHDP
jgi:hypothetical protein